ncbi:hypothetical protein APSETT444_006758 [Aspergillus pseudonomiae]
MPLIWNLKLPARQRIAVMSIFSLGIVVNVAGTVRTVYVYKSMIASQLERFEVYRTVEMETWTEARNPSEPADNAHSMPANHARVTTPNHDFDLKYDSAVYTSPASEKSSASLTRQTSSPFKDKHSI